MEFSKRMGLTPIAKSIQIDSIDNDLKNRLWNLYRRYLAFYFQKNEEKRPITNELFKQYLWDEFFKFSFDDMPRSDDKFIEFLQRFFFYKSTSWFRIYDLVEISVGLFIKVDKKKYISFYEEANSLFETEFAGYRFINGLLSPITNQSEISTISETLDLTLNFSALKPCNVHLTEALKKLSDKVQPDYRNSIKESISAVESLAKVLTNEPKATLGDALSKLRNLISLHRSLEEGFKKMYGYTSDTGGIRHALMDESTCDFEDAKYMLVSSSAFINFLIGKALKVGLI